MLLFKILLLEYQFFPEMFKQVRGSVMITKIRLYTEHETFFCVGPADGGCLYMVLYGICAHIVIM